MAIDSPMDDTIIRIIRRIRREAHLLNAWMAPNVSREGMILNECADRLEKVSLPSTRPFSEFDQLMK